MKSAGPSPPSWPASPATSCKWCARSGNGGFRTYALSNINDVVFPFVRDVLFTQEGLQLDDYFEKAYLSYEMHELKPSPEIYRKMIEKSGMRPEATLFIDDNAENLHTAQELGFHVYMPRPREDFRFLFDDGPGR